MTFVDQEPHGLPSDEQVIVGLLRAVHESRGLDEDAQARRRQLVAASVAPPAVTDARQALQLYFDRRPA